LTPYDIEMRNFDEVPRGILKEAKRQIKIMMQILDKNKYMPDYTYPLIDSYSIDTELCDLLFETESHLFKIATLSGQLTKQIFNSQESIFSRRILSKSRNVSVSTIVKTSYNNFSSKSK